MIFLALGDWYHLKANKILNSLFLYLKVIHYDDIAYSSLKSMSEFQVSL